MAYKAFRGGVITALGTNISHKTTQLGSLLPKTPRTLVFGSQEARSQEVNFALKSVSQPNFDVKYRRSFGFNIDAKVSNFNPFKDFGIQKNRTVLFSSLELSNKNRRSDRTFSTVATKTVPTNSTGLKEDITVEKDTSGYKIVIPLSNDEKCLFSIDTNITIKGFVDMIKEEDPSIKTISIFTNDGIKIASSTKLVDVFRSPFQLSVNNKKFQVSPRTSTISTIAKTSAFTSESYDELKKELAPLHRKKIELDQKSESQANWAMYAGLTYLTVQMAFLARLTWWDFNWDIMEPVTYFVTVGTAMISFVYFAVTRREYTYNDVRVSVLQNRMFKNYVKNNFPIEKYYSLEQKMKLIDPEAMDRLQWELDREHLKPNKTEIAV